MMTSFWRQVQSQSAKFFVLWVMANLLGGALLGYLSINWLQFSGSLFLAGSLLGTAQWSVLRLMSGKFRWWPLASTVGWIGGTIAWLVFTILFTPMMEALSDQLGSSIDTGGVIILLFWSVGLSLPQSLIFGCQGRGIAVWLLASILGIAIQFFSAPALYEMWYADISAAGLGSGAISAIAYGFGWATYGVVTGFAWLLLAQLARSERNVALRGKV